MDERNRVGMQDPAEYGRDADGPGAKAEGGSAPSWRAWALSIVAAIILSVTATLLLGGTFRLPGRAVAAGAGCGDPCCPPAAPAGR